MFVWLQEIEKYNAVQHPPLYATLSFCFRLSCLGLPHSKWNACDPKKGIGQLDALSSRLTPKIEGHRGGTRGMAMLPFVIPSPADDGGSVFTPLTLVCFLIKSPPQYGYTAWAAWTRQSWVHHLRFLNAIDPGSIPVSLEYFWAYISLVYAVLLSSTR